MITLDNDLVNKKESNKNDAVVRNDLGVVLLKKGRWGHSRPSTVLSICEEHGLEPAAYGRESEAGDGTVH